MAAAVVSELFSPSTASLSSRDVVRIRSGWIEAVTVNQHSRVRDLGPDARGISGVLVCAGSEAPAVCGFVADDAILAGLLRRFLCSVTAPWKVPQTLIGVRNGRARIRRSDGKIGGGCRSTAHVPTRSSTSFLCFHRSSGSPKACSRAWAAAGLAAEVYVLGRPRCCTAARTPSSSSPIAAATSRLRCPEAATQGSHAVRL